MMGQQLRQRLVMIALVVAASGLATAVNAQPPRGASTIEAAVPGLPYDYVIHVKNVYDYKYNPGVRSDRVMLAKEIVRPFCAKNQIVGESVFDTEIFGLLTGRLDYVLYIKCLGP